MNKKQCLMSIMTKHSNKIFNGTKAWEFRKAPPRINEGESLEIIVYSSKVEKMIVGKFTAGRILRCSFDELMNITGNEDAASITWFKTYYKGKELCCAIEILNPVKFDKPIKLEELTKAIPSFKAPQNFIYINEESELKRIIDECVIKK